MLTAQFFSGASLFALLIVDICCLPVKQGFNPSASHSYDNTNAALYHGSGQSAPGAALPVPLRESSYAPTGVGAPAGSLGSSSSSSGPALSGYGGSSVRRSPASSTGAAFQPASRDIDWAVAPPGIFSSAGEGMSAGTYGIDSSGPENVSPPLPPPGPMYQAGELSHSEQAFETGDYQTETEEQGFSPHLSVSAGGFTSQPLPESGSQPQPESSMGGSWGIYPYYDYMFLTGQYPPGTYAHYSSSNEQGNDNWQDVHYVRYHYPSPVQPVETLAVPQRFEDPKLPVKRPVMAGHRKGGAAAAGVSAPSRGRFVRRRQYEAPTLGQGGGYNPGKGHGY